MSSRLRVKPLNSVFTTKARRAPRSPRFKTSCFFCVFASSCYISQLNIHRQATYSTKVSTFQKLGVSWCSWCLGGKSLNSTSTTKPQRAPSLTKNQTSCSLCPWCLGGKSLNSVSTTKARRTPRGTKMLKLRALGVLGVLVVNLSSMTADRRASRGRASRASPRGAQGAARGPAGLRRDAEPFLGNPPSWRN